jgi:hypothetical protein
MALGNSPETEAQLIDNIPEGNLAFPKGRLAFPNTSTVKAAVDTQAQLSTNRDRSRWRGTTVGPLNSIMFQVVSQRHKPRKGSAPVPGAP